MIRNRIPLTIKFSLQKNLNEIEAWVGAEKKATIPFKHEQVDDRLLVLLFVLHLLFLPLLGVFLLGVLDGRADLLERELEVAVDVVAGAENLDLGVGKVQPEVER